MAQDQTSLPRRLAFSVYRRVVQALQHSPLERIPGLRDAHRRLMSAFGPNVTCVDGLTMHLDATDAMRLTTGGERSFGLEFLLSNLHPGNRIIDVGAHIGYYSLLMARRVGNSGRVFAIEADPDNHSTLIQNIKANQARNVTALLFAASCRESRANFYRSNCSALNRLHPSVHCSESHIVQARPLDSVTALIDGPVTCIKIDVEGHEPEVLEGARRILQTNPNASLFVEFAPCWLVEAGFNPAQFFKILVGNSSQVLHIDEERRGVEPAVLDDLIDRFPIKSEKTTNLWCIRGA